MYCKENPDYLRLSLESVFKQTLPPDEVVLVEDGPLTEELYQVVDDFVDRHHELKIIVNEKNCGLGISLNKGLKHCSYDIVARMDTDDICKPERFANQIAFFEKHSDIDVVGAFIDEFQDDITNVVSTRKLPEMPNEIYQFGKKQSPINHPVVMFRKESVESVGGYQPYYLFEDYYLWVRMLLSGMKFYNIQESLLWFRVSPQMFKRRGGLRYVRTEVGFLWKMYQMGYVSLVKTCQNILIRFMVRIAPNYIRSKVYKCIRNYTSSK